MDNKIEKNEIEKEELPTVNDIKAELEGLKARITAKQREKEEDISKKIVDRETLIAQAKENDELLLAARETFDYFITMKQLGELNDPSDIQKLEEISTLVASLEQRQVEINQRIEGISSHPEINAKLYDMAKQEDIERTAKTLFEQAHKQLDPQIDELVKSIKNLAENEQKAMEQLQNAESQRSEARQKIHNLYEQSITTLKEKSDFYPKLYYKRSQWGTAQELQEWLSGQRKSLGIFKGKEKAVLDTILSKEQEFKTLEQAEAQVVLASQELDSLRTQQMEFLIEQYKGLILKCWEEQNKINALTQKPHDATLPIDLRRQVENQIQQFKNKGAERIRVNWDKIDIAAGRYDLIYSNPRQKETSE